MARLCETSKASCDELSQVFLRCVCVCYKVKRNNPVQTVAESTADQPYG